MINDGDSQTSLLPIFPEGEGTSVHRINIFRHFGQRSEFFLRSCLETPVMTRQKSHAFYSEKIVRYIKFSIELESTSSNLFNLKISVKRTLSFGILRMKAFL